jgi:hypothetical protein
MEPSRSSTAAMDAQGRIHLVISDLAGAAPRRQARSATW